jgi:Alw26I/Eco31I/Esp3I family type II restriction m6 adenine DNA methyltransferase
MHRNIWKLAKSARELAYNSFSSDNVIKENLEVTNNILLELQERNPDKISNKVINLNLLITEKAVRSVLNDKALSLLDRVLVSNHVLELYAREIYLLNGAIFKNLSAAKANGFFFTPECISKKLLEANKLVSSDSFKVCDPASGGGALLAMLMLNSKVDKVVGFEKDEFSYFISKLILNKIKKELKLNTKIELHNIDSTTLLFNEKFSNTFDLVISNPPYGRIKHLADSLTNSETKVTLSDKKQSELNAKLVLENKVLSKKLKSSLVEFGLDSGTLELSKVFWGIAFKIAKSNGVISFITPNSWVGDKTSSKFRKYLFENHKIDKVFNIKENANFFQTVNQPTVITHIKKGEPTENVKFVGPINSLKDFDEEAVEINLNELLEADCELKRIPFKCVDAYTLFNRMSKLKKIKEIDGIKNLRGECDLTFFKSSIVSTGVKSTTRLIRGDHIEAFQLKHYSNSEKMGYVDFKKFTKLLGDSPKLEHVVTRRMVCPQCSYLDKKNRLYWGITQPGDIVANSANYIYFDDDSNGDELTSLMICLNSTPVEWFFRYFNSNNHIGNFEINELPTFKLDRKDLMKAKILVSKISNSKKSLSLEDQDAIDSFSMKYFELSAYELKYIKESVTNDKIRYVDNKSSINDFVNHNKTRLSDLDMQMVVSIPQGGNWTSIPETVQSQRVAQIREMSKERGMVRTSYYGRLKPEQPSYTISTYFNRPGNGTNIHPWENRTITAREAARLQSFPDSFAFVGPEGAVRNQIGNAVPPLLGVSVGKSVSKVVKNKTCVDLFCGAGGLSLGFENAGFEIVSSLDNDKWAIETHKKNLPNENTICGDITDESLFDEFILKTKKVLGRKKLGTLVGGPPCQGFSTAGWRKQDDKRNGLVAYFLRAVESLTPESVVIENVEGLLNMSKGEVVLDITRTLEGLGYTVNTPWLLRAEQYGVPQMRKRAFITAVKSGRKLPSRPLPVFDICKGRREKDNDRTTGKYPITVKEAIADLPPIEERAIDLDQCEFDRQGYSAYSRGHLSAIDFLSDFSQELS